MIESDSYLISGVLPNGQTATRTIRVIRPSALVLLKLLALSDRYRNIGGPSEAEHDREEARTHAADIVAIVSAQTDSRMFKECFQRQFSADPPLGLRASELLAEFFAEDTSPGILLYEEHISSNLPVDRDLRMHVRQELSRAYRLMSGLSQTLAAG